MLVFETMRVISSVQLSHVHSACLSRHLILLAFGRLEIGAQCVDDLHEARELLTLHFVMRLGYRQLLLDARLLNMKRNYCTLV